MPKTFLIHTDDGSVYKIDHGDIQRFRVPDDHPQLEGYKNLILQKQDDDDLCTFILAHTE